MQVLTVLALALLPGLLTRAGLLLCALDERNQRQSLGTPAGPWLEGLLARTGRGVSVEVVPADAPDAYWANTATISLSERTYGGRRPRDYAVAAHELGHADTLATHPVLPYLLPAARVCWGVGFRLAIGGLLASALFGEPAALVVGAVCLWVAIAAAAIVCIDETVASVRACDLLAKEALPRDAQLAAGRAMAAAGTAYALGAFGQCLLAFGFPLYAASLLGDSLTVRDPSDLGVWLVMSMTPIVLLRAGWVLYHVIMPEPVPTDLDLWALLGRESRWEAVCSVGVLALMLAMHRAVDGPVVAMAAALAIGVAIGPLGAMVAALTAMPRLLLNQFLARPKAPIRYLKPARDEVPEAMLAMWSNPPWYLRAVWLLPLGYLPLVALLAVRILSMPA